MYRFVVVIGLALVLLVAGVVGLVNAPGDRDAGPDRAAPAVDTRAFVSLGGQDLTSVAEGLRAQLRRLPKDDRTWATLGVAYVELARVTGDAGYYPQAADAIARSLELRPEDNAVALAAKAAMFSAQHEFAIALGYSEDALAIDGWEPLALAIRVDALTELGRYDEQLKALAVADRRQPGVPIAARYSYAQELRGDLEAASQTLARAAASASRGDRAYLLTLLADIDRRRGLLRESGRHLRTALAAAPDHVPAMVGRARLHVARGHLNAAVKQWRDVVRRLPLPEYHTELGELYLHLGRDRLARQQFAALERANRALAEGGVHADLESSIYEADHGSPDVALRDARHEWGHRQGIHVADAYAWALHVSGRDRQALRIAKQATSLGTVEPLLWLHRGMIEASLGKDRAARRHLERGLASDPGLSPWQADRARAVLATL